VPSPGNLAHPRGAAAPRTLCDSLVPVRAVEQSQACAEQHWHHLNVKFVDEAGPQRLLDHVGAEHLDDLVRGGHVGLGDRRLDAVGDECEGQVVVLLPATGCGWWVITKMGTWNS
jgi:hypothetical protein